MTGFAVELEADKTYRIDLRGSSSDSGNLHDPHLHGVHDANGNLLPGTTNDNGGRILDSRANFTPTQDATYYVAVGSVGRLVGTYTLSVAEVVDDFAATTETTGTVSVGSFATGDIDTAGDQDWFAVELEANTRYRIELLAGHARIGTLIDPFLYGVHDEDGQLISGTSDNDGHYSRRVYFTPTEKGTYYVAAAANGSEVGTYTLLVKSTKDDFEAGTGTTAQCRSATPRQEKSKPQVTSTGSPSCSRQTRPTGSPSGETLTIPTTCGVRTCTGSTTPTATSSPARRTPMES